MYITITTWMWMDRKEPCIYIVNVDGQMIVKEEENEYSTATICSRWIFETFEKRVARLPKADVDGLAIEM